MESDLVTSPEHQVCSLHIFMPPISSIFYGDYIALHQATAIAQKICQLHINTTINPYFSNIEKQV